MRLPALSLLLLLGACTGGAPPSFVELPPAAQPPGAGDPLRAAIIESAFVFGRPGQVAGQPAKVARALGQLEFLAEAMGSRPPGAHDGLAQPMLQQGRAEARRAFGIRPDASPQMAVDALFAAAVALEWGRRDEAALALTPIAAPGEAAAMRDRLDNLPHLPAAAAGTNRAYRLIAPPPRIFPTFRS
jgi:hypothetical protein